MRRGLSVRVKPPSKLRLNYKALSFKFAVNVISLKYIKQAVEINSGYNPYKKFVNCTIFGAIELW